MSGYQEIEYQVRDRVATISLNRPQARNGYTVTMANELADAFVRADRDSTVRVVVFTATGKDFCVGVDLTSGHLDIADTDTAVQENWAEPAGRCSMRIFAMNKPVIGAIRGAAVGAGSTIILPADYRLASTDARFGFVFSRRGIFPEGASTWFLPRLVGLGRAMDWMVSGRVFDASEALDAGLVHRLYAPDEVLDKAYELADELATKVAPISVAVIRQMLYQMSPVQSPLDVQRLDSKLIAGIMSNPDSVEGVMSFIQKRDPHFTLDPNTDLPDYLPWLKSEI